MVASQGAGEEKGVEKGAEKSNPDPRKGDSRAEDDDLLVGYHLGTHVKPACGLSCLPVTSNG